MSMFKGPSKPSSQFNFMPMQPDQLGPPVPLSLPQLPGVPQINVPQGGMPPSQATPGPQGNNDLLLQLLSNFKA